MTRLYLFSLPHGESVRTGTKEQFTNKSDNELPDPIPFAEDRIHAAYDADYANRYWRALLQADRVLKVFRAHFTGKCSPVHFFWGSNDLAVTRFSGRPAPTHPGGIPHLPDAVTREAYREEVSSAGFWPGGGAIAQPFSSNAAFMSSRQTSRRSRTRRAAASFASARARPSSSVTRSFATRT